MAQQVLYFLPPHTCKQTSVQQLPAPAAVASLASHGLAYILYHGFMRNRILKQVNSYRSAASSSAA